MRYTGRVVITDESGATVFERELTPQDMLDILLSPAAGRTYSINDAPRETSDGKKSFRAGLALAARTNGATPPAIAKKGVRKCGNCGRLGHSRRTCGAPLPIPKGPPLSEEEFDQVKSLQDDGIGMNAKEIMDELALEDMQQVNYAILSPTYATYLRNANQ